MSFCTYFLCHPHAVINNEQLNLWLTLSMPSLDTTLLVAFPFLNTSIHLPPIPLQHDIIPYERAKQRPVKTRFTMIPKKPLSSSFPRTGTAITLDSPYVLHATRSGLSFIYLL